MMSSAGNNDEARRNRGGTIRENTACGTSLSAWVAGTYRSALHASSVKGAVGWGDSSSGGGGGGKNGTGNGLPGGSEMEGGDGEQGAVDVNAYFVTDGAKPPAPKSLADCGAVPPKCSGFGPWVWLSALWGLYAGWLKRSPLLTKAITSGVLALGGDTAAQCFEYHEQGGTGPFFKVCVFFPSALDLVDLRLHAFSLRNCTC